MDNTKIVAVFGATGMLGKPVVQELVRAGFAVRALVRSVDKARNVLPSQVELVQGTLENPADIAKVVQDAQFVYLSLSVPYSAKQSQWHAEEDGFKNIQAESRKAGVQRVVYLSSLIINHKAYQDWWVFKLKHRAVQLVKEYPEWTVFYPSMFLDTIPERQTRGTSLTHAGRGLHKIHPIAGADYGRQVAKSLTLAAAANADFVVQGTEALLPEEILNTYAEHHPAPLKVKVAPIGVFKFIGLFVPTANFLAKIIDSINNMPEPFEAERTWQLLGKPEQTVASFAQMQKA